MNSRNKTLAGYAVLLLLLAGTARAEEDNQWHALAAYWSPLILQSTRASFVSDVVASFDFDGDWDGTNNQDFSRGMVLPSTVYYWVVETANQYYIGYAFYHLFRVEARNTEDERRFAHDMQGIVIAIQKNDDRPMGRFLGLTTWGDDRKPLYVEQTAVDDSDATAAAWRENIVFADDPPGGSRDINFMLGTGGFHPVIYAEAANHAIYGEKSETDFPEGPALYESHPVTDQRDVLKLRDGMSEAQRTRGHRPGDQTVSAAANGGVPKDDGLIYRHEDFGQIVIGPRTRGRGTVLHHWNLAGYDLQSLSAFWARRNDQQLLDTAGVFASTQETGPTSHPPWAWGAVFFDPAAYFDGLAGSKNETAASVTSTSFASTEEFAEQAEARKTSQ